MINRAIKEFATSLILKLEQEDTAMEAGKKSHRKSEK